jgi:hypothetical protein
MAGIGCSPDCSCFCSYTAAISTETECYGVTAANEKARIYRAFSASITLCLSSYHNRE